MKKLFVAALIAGVLFLATLLMGMAQKAIRAGIPVPGATTEEKSVVR